MTEKHQNYRTLRILYLGFCVGLLSIISIFIFTNLNDVGTLSLDLDLFTLFPLIIAGLSLFLMQLISKKKAEGIGVDVYDQDNIEEYRQLKILQWALIEGPALINAMFYFLLGYNLLHLLVACILEHLKWQQGKAVTLIRIQDSCNPSIIWNVIMVLKKLLN